MATVTCSCCGQVPEQGWVHLHSRRDIAICYRCLDWLNAMRAKDVAASGGGAAITGVVPSFSVADIDRAVDHYQRLGFRTSLVDQAHALARRDGLIIRLAHADRHPAGRGSIVLLHVDSADQLAGEWRLAGVAVTGPADDGSGAHEGAHTDPDGNTIRFRSPGPAAH